jgi:hypothetical protein
LAAKNVDPLTNDRSFEMGAQHWVETCGVCHVGGGSLEYDRDLNWYSAASGGGDAFIIKYAGLDDSNTAEDETSYVNVSPGFMNSSNKAEMDCLMCHLNESSPGSAWLRTLDCGPDNMIGPGNDPACAGSDTGYDPMIGMRTINTTKEIGVGEYDMFNRNFALKQYKPGLAASMGAGATGVFTGTELTGVDWGAPGAVTMSGSLIADTPKSESCAVCHARVDDTMGLPGMMGMRTGFGNFDLMYRPDVQGTLSVPGGINGTNQDLDTDNGPGAANDDFYQDFGCKTGMGKRAHKVSAEGDKVGANARYGMTPLLPSTLDMDPSTTPNPGQEIAGKMPDIDIHSMAGMQCATCHYALGSDKPEGYVDIPARTSHHMDYPAERVYGMDHQFAQPDSFPDTKGKNNLDNGVTCESCHIDRSHPNAAYAPIPTHAGFPQSHLDKIGCATCHVPETYSAPGRLKYRDWTAGFWHHAQKNVLDWNFDLMTGSHNTVPSMHRWAVKDAVIGDGTAKIYSVLPSLLPTWYQEVPNANLVIDDTTTVCVDDTVDYQVRTGIDVAGLAVGDTCDTDGEVALLSSTDDQSPDYAASLPSPVKTRDAAIVAQYVRDNGSWDGGTASGLGDGYCGPAMTCVGGVNNGNACMDRTDCTKFDIRINGANTFPLFDGFQLADGLEIDTKEEVDAMLAAFQDGVGGSLATHTTHLKVVQADFDVTHGIVPVEWALGGSARGGCVSCHSSKDPVMDMATGMPTNPNFNPNSVGFFEGYVQPMDNAGLMVGGYDVLKNWTAMFADFDCTAFCGMGQQDDSAFFNPMTGEIETGAVCTSGSMYNTIDECVAQMSQTFDVAMGFPSGTAMQMGMYDGISGLQGFTINTLQTMGTLECNPFGGPISASPMPDMNGNGLPDGNTNSCQPAPGLSPAFDMAMQMMGVMPTADGMATCGTITANVCDNGFRRGGGCADDADCRGAMTNTDEIAHSPMGLILSRKEVRSRQKIDLQQGYPGDDATGPNNIRWSISVTQNPGNPAHVASWDQAEYCIDRNPALYPNPFKPGAIPCRSIPYTEAECTAAGANWMGTPGGAGFCSSPQSPDGQRHIMNMIAANQYLGYTPTKLAELMVPMTGNYRNAIHEEHVTGQAMSCSDCHYNGTSDTNEAANLLVGYAVATDSSKPAAEQFTYTTHPVSGTATCATACHDVASAGAAPDVATARISSQHATDTNFSVHLDGSKSACYNVDLTTGQVTQGTNTYAWTITGTTTQNTCVADVANCDVTWDAGGTNDVTLDISCDAGGTASSATVGVTGFDVGAGPNADPTLTATVAGNTVTLEATTLDGEVNDVQILWGDFTRLTVTTLTTPAVGDLVSADGTDDVAHTYAESGTYSVTVVTTNDGDPNNTQYTYPLTVVIP